MGQEFVFENCLGKPLSKTLKFSWQSASRKILTFGTLGPAWGQTVDLTSWGG